MTKLQLFKHISQEQIFAAFIPDFKGIGKKYKSPFTDKDNKPSLHIYEQNGTVFFKSHNSGHQGDCLQFVADLNSLNCKTNLTAVIQIIVDKCNIKQGVYTKSEATLTVESNTETKTKNVSIEFVKAYTNEFIAYFGRYSINVETLLKFGVKQVSKHNFISAAGKVCNFDYIKLKQVVACYTVNKRIKLYIPAIDSKQKKMFGFKNQTKEDVFGLEQITGSCKSIFITAGEKDCLAINAIGYNAICFQSENTSVTESQINTLRTFTNKLFVIYDNDEAGKLAAEKLCKKYDLINVSCPELYKDIAEYLSIYKKKDFEALISKELEKIEAVKNKINIEVPIPEADQYTIFHATENYLKKFYQFRYNTIKLDIEFCKLKNSDWQSVNENDLFIELNKAGIKIGMNNLLAILKSNFVDHFNPLKNYFENLEKWNGTTDYIGQYISYLKFDDKNIIEAFKKWCVRSVACALVPGFYNKQAFIIIHSEQDSGKSSWCRNICPTLLGDYIAENISDDKDSKIALASNFIINLDELSSLSKYEINSLKSLFSKDIINERLPYDRKNSIIQRIANFIGSTNMAEFLTDETGSVRWLCFEIKAINWAYRQEFKVNNLWSQAYSLFKDSKYDFTMTKEDIQENEKRNAKFQQKSTEAELIPKYLQPSNASAFESEFMTASDILVYLNIWCPGIKFNKINIGRAMPTISFVRIKETMSDRYGYYCMKLCK